MIFVIFPTKNFLYRKKISNFIITDHCVVIIKVAMLFYDISLFDFIVIYLDKVFY